MLAHRTILATCEDGRLTKPSSF